jgi:hypothetical protein
MSQGNGKLTHAPTAGSWKPGQSGNPSGRPKGRQSDILARTAKQRAELYVDQAFNLLSKAVRDKDSPMAARVSAANAILDRAYGKAPQDVNVRGSVEYHIISLLKAIDNQDVKQIDGEATEVQPDTEQPTPSDRQDTT